jgi:hypothetical protein
MNIPRCTTIFLLMAILVMNTGCEWLLREKAQRLKAGYDQALASGKRDIEIIKAFYDMFPSAESYISYYTSEVSDSIWNSNIALYNRYVLSMRVPIEMNADRIRIVKSGDPRFVLVEVESISPVNGYVTYNTDFQKNFGIIEWKKVVESKGDFSVIGVHLIKDKPVANFTDFWKKS